MVMRAPATPGHPALLDEPQGRRAPAARQEAGNAAVQEAMAPVKTSPGPAVASPPYPSSASQAMSGTTRLASPRPISYGVGVPARARDHVTTDELLAVTGSTRDTLYEWVAQKLLDRPRIATDANGHQFAAWPTETLERVRFIVASQRQGTKMNDISLLVEARWPRR